MGPREEHNWPEPLPDACQDLPHLGSRGAFLSQWLGARGRETGPAEPLRVPTSSVVCGGPGPGSKNGWVPPAVRRETAESPPSGSLFSARLPPCSGCSFCLECPLHFRLQESSSLSLRCHPRPPLSLGSGGTGILYTKEGRGGTSLPPPCCRCLFF